MVLRQLTPRVRDRLGDAAAIGFAALGAIVVLLAQSRDYPPGSVFWWVNLIGGLAAVLLLTVRRTRPQLAAWSVFAVQLAADSAGMASVVVLLTLTLYRPLRYPVSYTLASLFISPVPLILRGQPPSLGSNLSTVLLVLVVSTAVIASGLAVRARRELLASLVERAERAEAEQRLRAENIRQAERNRIAREMHDVLAHRIALLNMHAGALAHRRSASRQETAEAAEVIRGTAREAMNDLRVLLGVLRSPAGLAGEPDEETAPQPTLAGLDALLADVRAAGMTVHSRLELDDPAAVPELSGRTLYRVAQEALTNAAKHAPTAPVTLALTGAPGAGVLLEVTNPLRRAAAELPGAGAGLVGITERATLAEGTVVHCGTEESAEGTRFRVAVRLPWPV